MKKTNEKGWGRRALAAACDAALLTLALWAVALCMCSVFAIDVRWDWLGRGIVAAGLGFGLFWALPRYKRWLFPVLGAAWGVSLWQLWDVLVWGEVSVRCSVVNTMARKVSTISRLVPIDPPPGVPQIDPGPYAGWAENGLMQEAAQAARGMECVTIWFLVLGAAYAFALGWLVCRRGRFFAPFLLTLLPLLPALCVTEAPAAMPMGLLLTVWGTLALRSLCRKADPAGGAVMTPHAMAASALTVAILMQVMPVEGYTQSGWAAELKENAISAAYRMDLSRLGSKLFGQTGAGSTEYVSLTGDGLGYTGRTALRIRADRAGKYYLRGYSADVYAGERWEPFAGEERDEFDRITERMETQPLLALGKAEKRAGGRLSYRNGEQTWVEPAVFEMEVENLSAPGSCVYYPYAMTAAPKGARAEESHLARTGGWKTTAEFLPVTVPAAAADYFGLWTVLGRYPGVSPYVSVYTSVTTSSYGDPAVDEIGEETQNDETWKEYQDFVYQHYLQIPEGVREELALWLEWIGMAADPESVKTNQELFRWNWLEYFSSSENGAVYGFQLDELPDDPAALGVREREGWRNEYAMAVIESLGVSLENTTRYDVNAPAQPEGEDYAAWFLNERRTGYCMHYATAATLLLRLMGVPARYVSGYVVNLPQAGQADIPDRAAHAWVEVWFDGLGWYPVEFTPGFEGDRTGPDSDNTAALPTPSPTAHPFDPNDWDDGDEDGEPTPTPAPTQAPAGAGGEDFGGPGWSALLFIPAALALLAAGWVLARRRRTRKLHGPDTNAAVLYALRLHRRLERLGCPGDGELETLGEKAKFSQHTLSQAEREQALRILERDRKKTLRKKAARRT